MSVTNKLVAIRTRLVIDQLWLVANLVNILFMKSSKFQPKQIFMNTGITQFCYCIVFLKLVTMVVKERGGDMLQKGV